MNAISIEVPLGAPVRRGIVTNGAQPRLIPASRSRDKRIWIIGSSISHAEKAALVILAIASLLGIGKCFAVLGAHTLNPDRLAAHDVSLAR